jgi:hypothetical protein
MLAYPSLCTYFKFIFHASCCWIIFHASCCWISDGEQGRTPAYYIEYLVHLKYYCEALASRRSCHFLP